MIRRIVARWLSLVELDSKAHFLGSAGLWLVSGIWVGINLPNTNNPATWPPLITAYVGFSLLSYVGANVISSWILFARVGPKHIMKLWAFTALGATAGIVLQKLFWG
ncbi:hypothetical protein C4571_03500 [Candidatus Parcubacteria bacterium]|nr:MAG: hypothetical protein C4571_03500 [Candidatus Parcubacteria bacterium]